VQEGLKEGDDRIVQFMTGTPEQVEEAMILVAGLIAQGADYLNGGGSESSGGAQGSSGAGGASEVIKFEADIDPAKVGLVIGAKGSVIAQIMARSGCKVSINQDFPAGEMHRVVYSGTVDQISAAKAFVETVVKSGALFLLTPNNPHAPQISQEVHVLQAHVGRLFADGSHMINDVSQRFRMEMDVDIHMMMGSDGSGVHKISLSGPVECVESAMNYLHHVVGSFPSSVDKSQLPPPSSSSSGASAGAYRGA
jgi:hypothetical protein